MNFSVPSKELFPLYSVDNPTTAEFIEMYESKGKPVIIKNYPLDWKAFHWTDKYVSDTLDCPEYDTFIEKYPISINSYSPGDYLFDIPVSKTPLKDDYSTPDLFKDAECQPYFWAWLFFGPPGTTTAIHQDADNSQAWNVCIKGYKLWWFWHEGKCLSTVSGPGEIIFAPPNVWHAVVNLTSSISITHNYKRVGTVSDNYKRGVN